MSRKVVTLEIDSDLEPLLRDYATFLDEMKHLAKTAPQGTVLTTCEQAVVQRNADASISVAFWSRPFRLALTTPKKRGAAETVLVRPGA